jgi:5'(3')-deoxyribonucleotidase
VTCHNLLGAEYKLRWIKNNLPMIDEVTIIPIEHGLVKFDKSSVDGMVLIDDSISALQTSKAKYKYLYGSFRWNNSCNEFKRIASWLDFYEEIKSIEKKEGN